MEIYRFSPDDPNASSSHPKYGEPTPLNLGCRIFISHSGRDKPFVRYLHDKLVHILYCDERLVFFDEESLPTAEPISMENILAEARGCELGILVLTKDFFMHTPNPMLELEALTTSNVRLLPLFFGISVDEFKKMKHEDVWEEQWREWLKGDEQRLGAWKRALNYVDRFSGLEKFKGGVSDLDYINKIVGKVAFIVLPAVSFSEEGVCGMDRICQIVNEMYKRCASKRASEGQTQLISASPSTVRRDDSGNSSDLVGIYGFAGLGKSTLCRALCDFYRADFRGRVLLLDLGSVPLSSHALSRTCSSMSASMLRMQYLLSLLTDINKYVQLTEIQIQNLLKNWIKKYPVFLAIDNILDRKDLEEARFYLGCEFAKGSKVLITSRGGKVLEHIESVYTKFSTVIEQIPRLDPEEGRDIFMHEISGKQGKIPDVEEEVKECVSMCVVCIGHMCDDGKWYHPLMLKMSAKSIINDRRSNVDLKSRLREFVQSAAGVDRSRALDTVFNMLDISYAILGENEKKVFLDLALSYKVIAPQSVYGWSTYAWIQTVHSHLNGNTLENILLTLEDLSFIVMKDGTYGRYVQLHDLMVDFSMHKMMEGADTTCLNPHYLLLDNGSQLMNSAFGFPARNKWPSNSNALKSVRAVSVSRCSKRPDLEQVDLRNFEGLEVLHLVDNPGLHQVLLSCTTLAHLRSFIVRVPGDSALLCRIIDECSSMPNQMMTGGQLVWVELEGNITLSTCMDGIEILRPFLCNLQHLVLSKFPAKSIDVTTCTNLIRMNLKEMPRLSAIHGLETLTNLKELVLFRCGPNIIDVTTLINLEELNLIYMPSLSSIHGLQTLTSLRRVAVFGCEKVQMLSIPANLEKLSANSCNSLERIYLPTMIPHQGELIISKCPALRNAGGLDQYTGSVSCSDVAIQDLESFETGLSKFGATIKCLELKGSGVQWLDGLIEMDIEDVQHVGLFIAALVKAQPRYLQHLRISCKKDGDCGCAKIESYFFPGLLPSCCFVYQCPQVRNIASLSMIMGNGLRCLDLRGCRNVEVWPDFATMTSLEELFLSSTSLKEWPTGVHLLCRLWKLDIQDCRQLPAEEMINAITSNTLGCNSACGRGSLASLWADLKGCRRDGGSVADALASRWPEIVSLFCQQWRYLRYPCGTLSSSCPIRPVGSLCHAELCYLIRVMYDLWFGVEGKAGSSNKHCCPCADGVPKIKEKLKPILCSENFISLPFYVWRIGRTRACALDEWEGYPWPEGYEIYMAFALIGSASIGCFNAPLNDDLKDRIVNFIQSFAEAQPQHAVNKNFDILNVLPDLETPDRIDKDAHERLAMRVGDAVCQMARAPSVAAALGQDFMHITMDGLKASYNTMEISQEEYMSLIGWMLFTSSRSSSKVRKKISCVAAESGKASMSLDDDMGARVLRKIMPKILSISALEFHGVSDDNYDWTSYKITNFNQRRYFEISRKLGSRVIKFWHPTLKCARYYQSLGL